MVEDHWNNGRIIVAINNEAQSFKSEAEIARVECDSLKTLEANRGGSDLTVGREDLHQDRRSWRFPEVHCSVRES